MSALLEVLDRAVDELVDERVVAARREFEAREQDIARRMYRRVMAAAEREALERQGGEVYAHIVEDLRQSAVTTDELASIAGVHGRQVQNWAAGRNKPQGEHRDHLLELHYLVKRLRDVYQPEGVEIWLHGRNRDLGGQRPLDLLRAGEFETVLSAVERLVDGTM